MESAARFKWGRVISGRMDGAAEGPIPLSRRRLGCLFEGRASRPARQPTVCEEAVQVVPDLRLRPTRTPVGDWGSLDSWNYVEEREGVRQGDRKRTGLGRTTRRNGQ